MRIGYLLFMIMFLGACGSFNRVVATAVGPNPTSKIKFVQVTATPTPTIAATKSATSIPDRAFENGVPLAARVNDEPIYLETYQRRIAVFEESILAQNRVASDALNMADLASIRKRVLEGLIEEELIKQQAQQLGIVNTGTELENKTDEVIVAITQRSIFEEWLAENRLSHQQFVDNLQTELLTQHIFEQITRDVPDYAEQIHLQSIKVDDVAKAQLLVDRLKQGADFITLAQENSLDGPDVDLGWFPRETGWLPEEVESIAFNLQAGEVSGPIYTSAGLFIIRLEAKESNKSLTQPIHQRLKRQRFENWLQEQKAKATIEKFVTL